MVALHVTMMFVDDATLETLVPVLVLVLEATAAYQIETSRTYWHIHHNMLQFQEMMPHLPHTCVLYHA